MFKTKCKNSFKNDPIIHTDYGNSIIRLSKEYHPFCY